ncbi:nucleotidyltransferase domain-containing protein [Rathayibacter festucae]|uniref:nucleotidyltransferase domain-containing protein n=1 Tax=Rathayibacter festucae TaxID=110937 RepID=UPI001FB2F67F|nr:nucleotidyltransferase domain-containing protein [Rathayibacter festucae]MCJ1700501.1 nucleotidyltransferase domain-containing protein [Rathayibacter festucae]
MAFGLQNLPTVFESSLNEIVAANGAQRLGLMVYGSVARGTAKVDSDLDLLEVVSTKVASYSHGPVNVTQYTPASLHSMSSAGELFIRHLSTEGIILQDPFSILSNLLQASVCNYSATDAEQDFRAVSGVLDLNNLTLAPTEEEVDAVARLGIYLLRSITYLRRDLDGKPSFELTGPDVPVSLSLRRQSSFTLEDVARIRSDLSELIGNPQFNEYGSVELFSILKPSNRRQNGLLARVRHSNEIFEYAEATFV